MASPVNGRGESEVMVKNVLDTLRADGSFETLLALLQMAGLTESLREPGPITLFAPDDDAYKRVNVEEISGDKEKLATLLTYHMVQGKLTAADVARDELLLTMSGKSLTVQLEEGHQVIDNAKYVRTDIECSNGIIHVIDNVFLPHLSGWYCSSC